jgi:hypothetical protein
MKTPFSNHEAARLQFMTACRQFITVGNNFFQSNAKALMTNDFFVIISAFFYSFFMRLTLKMKPDLLFIQPLRKIPSAFCKAGR